MDSPSDIAIGGSVSGQYVNVGGQQVHINQLQIVVNDLQTALTLADLNDLLRQLNANRDDLQQATKPLTLPTLDDDEDDLASEAFHTQRRITNYDAWVEAVKYFLPPEPDQALFGRELQVKQISGYLHQSQSVLLRGVSGIGKTLIARTMFRRRDFREAGFKRVLWIDGNADVSDVLDRWAVFLDISSDEIQKAGTVEAKRELIQTMMPRTSDYKTLVIVDDVVDVAQTRSLVFGEQPNLAYLFTTNLDDIAKSDLHPKLGELVLLPLTIEEGEALLAATIDVTIPSDLTPVARQLVIAQKGIARDIVLRGRIITRKQRAGVSLHQALSDALADRDSIELAFESLEQDARDLLVALSLLPPIPRGLSHQLAQALALQPVPVDATLESLVTARLLEYGTPDGVRYSINRTVAEYIQNHHPAGENIKRRLVAHYVAILDHTAEQPLTLAQQFRDEDENISRVLSIAHENGFDELLIDGTIAAFEFWDMRGKLSRADMHLQRALSVDEARVTTPQTTLATARLEYYRSRVLLRQGDIAAAIYYVERGLTTVKLAPQSERRELEIDLLVHAGRVRYRRGDDEAVQQAVNAWETARSQADPAHDPLQLSRVTLNLAIHYREADQNKAIALLNESIAHATQTQDLGHTSLAYAQRGNFESQYLKAFSEAAKSFNEAYRLAQQIDNAERIGQALQGYGNMAMDVATDAAERGDEAVTQKWYAIASKAFSRALRNATDSQNNLDIGYALLAQAEMYLDRGMYEETETALGQFREYPAALLYPQHRGLLMELLIESGRGRLDQTPPECTYNARLWLKLIEFKTDHATDTDFTAQCDAASAVYKSLVTACRPAPPTRPS